MAKPQKFKDKWRVRWMDHTGKRNSRVFSSKSDAQFFLMERELETHQIRTGLKLPPAEIITFEQLADYWRKHRAAYKRSCKHDESILSTHLVPYFKNKAISAIKPIDAESLRQRLSGRSDKTIHNILTLLISMLNAAKDQGWINLVPKIKKPKITILEKDFRYFKSTEEIERFLRTAFIYDKNAYDLYAVAIHTGLRAGELGHLQFQDIDFDKNLIYVTGSWGGPTKSGQSRVVPLLPAIKNILVRRRNLAFSNHVFYNKRGNPLQPSDRIFQETFQTIATQAGFPKVKKYESYIPYINFHGLRHTFASHWVMKGHDLFKLQKVLGHQDVKMTQRYAHLSENAFNEMLKDGLNAIPDFNSQNIIQFDNSPVRISEQVNEYKYKTPI